MRPATPSISLGTRPGTLAHRLRNPERQRFMTARPALRLLLGEVTGEELAGLHL